MLLSIDTSLTGCAVAVAEGEKILASAWHQAPSSHAEALLATLDAALKQAGITLQNINAIVVCIGPGSFAGIRAGIASAYGIEQVIKCRMLGISSLERIAFETQQQHVSRAGKILSVIDAYRGQVYASIYDHTLALQSEPIAIDHADIASIFNDALPEQCTVSGNGAMLVKPYLPASWNYVEFPPRNPAEMLALRAQDYSTWPEEKPLPLYIRPPDAKLPGLSS